MFIDPKGLIPVIADVIAGKNKDVSIEYVMEGGWMTPKVKATVGNQSAYIPHTTVGNNRIIDSEDLIALGLPRYRAEHQTHVDRFESADQAALAWAMKYYALSDRERKEYAAWIYKDSEDQYFFGMHSVGTSTGIVVQAPLTGENYQMVALIHSHPTGLGVDTNSFSIRLANRMPGPDGSFVYDSKVNFGYNVPLYLASYDKVRTLTYSPNNSGTAYPNYDVYTKVPHYGYEIVGIPYSNRLNSKWY